MARARREGQRRLGRAMARAMISARRYLLEKFLQPARAEAMPDTASGASSAARARRRRTRCRRAQELEGRPPPTPSRRSAGAATRSRSSITPPPRRTSPKSTRGHSRVPIFGMSASTRHQPAAPRRRLRWASEILAQRTLASAAESMKLRTHRQRVFVKLSPATRVAQPAKRDLPRRRYFSASARCRHISR